MPVNIWPVIAAVIGALLSIISGLIFLNLKSIKKCLSSLAERVTTQDEAIAEIRRDFTACKIDCDRNTVSKEDWVRSEAFTRDKLDKVVAALNRMEGQLSIAEKMPQIAGTIAREIASQLKTGG